MEHQKIGLRWMQKMEDSSNYRGGILTDDTGLGKTIQAIAVIIANPCTDYTPVNYSINQLGPGELRVKATLIICHVSLINQWKKEIETKSSPQLKVLVNHGQGRPVDPYDFSLYDVVLTSYSVNAVSFKRNNPGPLSKVTFHRVILDGAHKITNAKNSAGIGCCSLQATYRWFLTAKPVQKNFSGFIS